MKFGSGSAEGDAKLGDMIPITEASANDDARMYSCGLQIRVRGH